MIHQVWRLNEPGDHNLGLACTEQGLLLGRTPLIERRNGRFAVRERSEIERLLSRAYRAELPLERLMAGLTTVASAFERKRSGPGADCGGPFADTRPAELNRAGRDGGGRYPHQVGRLESRPASADRRTAKSRLVCPERDRTAIPRASSRKRHTPAAPRSFTHSQGRVDDPAIVGRYTGKSFPDSTDS